MSLQFEIRDLLKRERLMTLASVDEQGHPRVCSVFYALGINMRLYFISHPSSYHIQHLKKYPYAAAAIYDSRQRANENRIGLQMIGNFEYFEDMATVSRALKYWHTANPGLEDTLSFKNIRDDEVSSRIFRFVPSEIKYLNEELGGAKKLRVWKKV